MRRVRSIYPRLPSSPLKAPLVHSSVFRCDTTLILCFRSAVSRAPEVGAAHGALERAEGVVFSALAGHALTLRRQVVDHPLRKRAMSLMIQMVRGGDSPPVVGRTILPTAGD
jgi:hypothetical protein